MKEVKMDYSEYEEMVKLIKTQQDTIEVFMKQPNVVLVDKRYGVELLRYSWSKFVPKIVCDTEKAKEWLRIEFNDLYKKAEELEQTIERLRCEQLHREQQSLKPKAEKKNLWWWLVNHI